MGRGCPMRRPSFFSKVTEENRYISPIHLPYISLQETRGDFRFYGKTLPDFNIKP